ncbi:hypothetical protein OJ253_2001 [Cryptosporidium canis]|uniref:Uncharacterized protein n=1 Tax=Cryptosporidium canis TaxID=195482 RepID=A0A9D5HX21_9CRYT|nr:hypothetical protein OJ253_2001 [Cryptosporidium canis]
MSSENVKVESENVGKSILSPENRNRTLLLKKKDVDSKVMDNGAKGEGGELSPMIKITPANSLKKLQAAPKREEVISKSVLKGDFSKSSMKKDDSLGKKTVVDITNSGLLGLSGKLREKKQSVPLNIPKSLVNVDIGKVESQKNIKSPSALTGSTMGMKNLQSSMNVKNLIGRVNAAREVNLGPRDLDITRARLVKANKSNMNNRPHLFGHEPATYTTNPLVIEDLIDELEEKAKNYFIMFSKERKEREKLERQCYWMQEENKTLQNTLKNQITTIQGLQNKIIDLRGNPNVITETIERIDMLYTQLDTLIQAFAGICSYITFNEPTDRREIIELVLEYLHPCRGLDLRLNSLYGSIYYFKLGIIKDLPPPIQPPEKIPGYDVWQPPPPQKVEAKDSDDSKLPPHMQQGNSLSKVADNYMKDDKEVGMKASISDRGHDDDHGMPKISTPVASTKQSVVPTSSSQLSGDINIPLSGFEIKIKSVQGIEPIGNGKGKLSFVARIDNESSIQSKNNPKRRSMEFEYTINPTNNKGSIEQSMSMEIDVLPPKSPGLLPRFTIDMWDSSVTSSPIGHASKTFIDPYTLLAEQPWDVVKDDSEKPIATLMVTVLPKPGTSMLPAGRFIVAKEAKNKQEPAARKESKLSRLGLRGDKEGKGLDKINSMLRPALNIGKKRSINLDDKDNKSDKLLKAADLTSSMAKPLSMKESISAPPNNIAATNKSETPEPPNMLKSTQITAKELQKSSPPEPTAVPPIVKKSMNEALPPPKVDLKSSIKVSIGPVPGKTEDPAAAAAAAANNTTTPTLPKSTEPTPKDSLAKSGQIAPKPDLAKSDLLKSNIAKPDQLKKSGELLKPSIGDPKSIALKKSPPGETGVNKSEAAPKVAPHVEIKVLPSPKIVPKIVPKPAITKDSPSAPKAVQAANLTPAKPGQVVAPPTIVKKIDIKPVAIKPKIAAATTPINIKKPGSPIQIKPKGIELGKPAVTITPKLAVTPPKPVSGAVAPGNKAVTPINVVAPPASKAVAPGNKAVAQPKEEIKIVVNKGAVNISPKIVPKVKITPKVKI